MNNFTHRASLLCEASIIDSVSNNISLLNVLEEITFALNVDDYEKEIGEKFNKRDEITVPAKFEIISFWDNHKKREKLNICIDFLSPDGKSISSMEPDLRFNPEKPRVRSSIKITGLKLTPKTGIYKFVIKYRNNNKEIYENITEIPLQINFNIS